MTTPRLVWDSARDAAPEEPAPRGGRVIVVHSREAVLDTRGGTPAHCFGPFADYEAARAWDADHWDDCWKVALDLIGPEPEDVAAEPVHTPAHNGGWR